MLLVLVLEMLASLFQLMLLSARNTVSIQIVFGFTDEITLRT